MFLEAAAAGVRPVAGAAAGPTRRWSRGDRAWRSARPDDPGRWPRPCGGSWPIPMVAGLRGGGPAAGPAASLSTTPCSPLGWPTVRKRRLTAPAPADCPTGPASGRPRGQTRRVTVAEQATEHMVGGHPAARLSRSSLTSSATRTGRPTSKSSLCDERDDRGPPRPWSRSGGRVRRSTSDRPAYD